MASSVVSRCFQVCARGDVAVKDGPEGALDVADMGLVEDSAVRQLLDVGVNGHVSFPGGHRFGRRRGMTEVYLVRAAENVQFDGAEEVSGEPAEALEPPTGLLGPSSMEWFSVKRRAAPDRAPRAGSVSGRSVLVRFARVRRAATRRQEQASRPVAGSCAHTHARVCRGVARELRNAKSAAGRRCRLRTDRSMTATLMFIAHLHPVQAADGEVSGEAAAYGRASALTRPPGPRTVAIFRGTPRTPGVVETPKLVLPMSL